jgi:tetratricopeptide (TPR) repeat protein
MSVSGRGRAIRRAVAVVVAAAAGIALAACVSVKRATVEPGPSDTARHLAAGEYQKAIDLQKAMRLKEPRNRKVAAEYVATVEEIKRAADAAYGKADYVTAAGTYKILVDSWYEDKAVAGALTFEKSDLEAGLKSCRGAIRGQEIRRGMKAGNFTKAVGLYRAALKDQPEEKSARADYASAILEIKAAGDKALAGRDYATAGRIHGLLLNNLESFEGLEGIGGKAAAASLKKDRLVDTIKVCSQSLTNSGLAEYRKGNLEEAIAIWDSLLVFDPGNAEIKKAVETAKAQLGKVKRVGVGPQHQSYFK